MALMNLFPLSPPQQATFPHVLESSGIPPVPNPTLESHVSQSFCSLLRIPILALVPPSQAALNPSLLQLVCRDA